MTQLQLELSRGAYKVTFIFEYIINVFKKMIKIIVDGNQRKANEEIARFLKKEYPHQSYNYILKMVEKGKIHEIAK